MIRQRGAEAVGDALVQIWGKGYRLTADSEEFQRFYPVQLEDERSLEVKLRSMRWGPVLDALQSLTNRELGSQACILFGEREILSVAFARASDRHNRPSLVMVSALAEVDWNRPSLAETTAQLAAISSRLSEEYAGVLSGNPSAVYQQLQSGAFLRSRVFSLKEESATSGVDWTRIMTAARSLNGISGVATVKLLGLGANVLLGTKYEADRAQSQRLVVDGYYDVRRGEILPIGEQLVPWNSPPKQEDPLPEPERVEPVQPFQKEILELLRNIDKGVEQAVILLKRIVENTNRPEKKKKGW